MTHLEHPTKVHFEPRSIMSANQLRPRLDSPVVGHGVTFYHDVWALRNRDLLPDGALRLAGFVGREVCDLSNV